MSKGRKPMGEGRSPQASNDLTFMKAQLLKNRCQKFASMVRYLSHVIVLMGGMMCGLYLCLDSQFTNIWNKDIAIILLCMGLALRIVSDFLIPQICKAMVFRLMDNISFDEILGEMKGEKDNDSDSKGDNND